MSYFADIGNWLGGMGNVFSSTFQGLGSALGSGDLWRRALGVGQAGLDLWNQLQPYFAAPDLPAAGRWMPGPSPIAPMMREMGGGPDRAAAMRRLLEQWSLTRRMRGVDDTATDAATRFALFQAEHPDLWNQIAQGLSFEFTPWDVYGGAA